MSTLKYFLLGFLCLSLSAIQAENEEIIIQQFLNSNLEEMNLEETDVQNWIITDNYVSKHINVRHVYIKQTYKDIEVFNGLANFNLLNGKVFSHGNRLISNLAEKTNTLTPVLNPVEAVDFAAKHFNIEFNENIRIVTGNSTKEFFLKNDEISVDLIPVKLVLFGTDEGELKLSWDLSIHALDHQNWWSVRVDATNGEILDVINWVTHCSFYHHADKDKNDAAPVNVNQSQTNSIQAKKMPNSYNVFAPPVESPNHGPRTIEVDPADPTSSPFGWHDTDGSPGAEFTVTRGNNVYASDDIDNDNVPGYSPDGGSNLEFDFALDLSIAPDQNLDAAITNLFYWNNIMHDVWYHYGFDEVSGNFQENNYGNGGIGSDYVNADAQDGSGTNNANFATPPDGSNPRMQMFIWDGFGVDKDSDFDNGVIAHEFGHGISNRLVGGPSNTGCLGNDEQMGEGWSDWFGLMMTIKPGDQPTDVRPIGTFVSNQTVTSTGIRNEPYTTDFSENAFTYAATNNTNSVSQPHGVGFVWATMLWDMTWMLIDKYGFDADLYNGTGGNNIAMQLVMDGLKLMACNPGFIDGRDAILQADQLLYAGANQCEIWEVFANRGLGANASQGSSNDRTDQVEDFSIPNICITATSKPSAAIDSDIDTTCTGTIQFFDESTDVPQFYLWDFGGGVTSTEQNPIHTFTSEGIHLVQLVVTNNVGSDTTFKVIWVELAEAPFATGVDVCQGESTILSGVATGTLRWYDANQNFIGTGTNFSTNPITGNTTFYAENALIGTADFVGPSTNAFGTGGYHGTNFTGTVDFEALVPLNILSAWVDAEFPGERDFFLWDENGNELQQVTVNIPFTGAGRIELGFDVPSAGNYSIGGTGVDLYRNDAGANYPYVIPGLINVTGSSAGTDFYYYLYDLEVVEAPCVSARIPVNIDIIDAGFTFQVNNNTFTFFSNFNGSSYLWDFGDGTSSTLANPSHTYSQVGSYDVTLTVNNCSKTQTVSQALGINDIENTLFNVYPNPTDDVVFVQFTNQAENKDLNISLLTIEGKEVIRGFTHYGNDNLVSLDVSELSSGTYILKVRSENESFIERLIVK